MKLTFLTTFVLLLLAGPRYLHAQTSQLAGVVVDFGGGQVQTFCVAFPEEQISGYEALRRTGLPLEVEASGMGAAVCQIGQTGCPSNHCFCQCPGGANCNYWSYWHLNGGSWQYAQGGASQYMVRHGAVEGWVWGAGGSGNASPPMSTSFEQVCAAHLAPTATPTAVPTHTPLPTATATAVPPTITPSPTPANTTTPLVQFSAVATAVASGHCTELVWEVQHVQAVYLDGAGVSGQGRQQVCPSHTAVYQLRVVHAAGEQVAQVTVQVVAGTNTPNPSATAAPVAIAPVGGMASPTAVPTETPSPPLAEAPLPTATLWPTEPPPTREHIVVQLPLANTATSVAVAQVQEEVEVVVATPTMVWATAVAMPAEPTPPPFDWVGYGLFLLLMAVLGLMRLFIR